MTATTAMPATRSRASRPAARLLTALMLASGMFGGVAVSAAAPAQAAGVTYATGVKALNSAAAKKGAPYKWGAVGPTRFDCSGLTLWVYKSAGKKLPRTAAQQYAATIRVSKASRRLGDLVFFMDGRNVYHVGIYAGSGKLWHAPKPGDRVKLANIWTSAVRYGRVR